MTESEKQITVNLKTIMILSMSSIMASSFLDKRTRQGKTLFEFHQKLLTEYSQAAKAISELDPDKDTSVLLSAIMMSMLKATIQIMSVYPGSSKTINRKTE
jgi:hypothetical protein